MEADGAWDELVGRGGEKGVSSGAEWIIVLGCTSDKGSGSGAAHADEGGFEGRKDLRIFL